MIDLSLLPPPELIESLDFETIYSARKARFLASWPPEQQPEVAARLELESEPMVKLLQENSYQELLLRQRVNDAARAVLFPHSTDDDLDNLAAFFDVQRLPDELDSALRERAMLSLHSLSVAGPANAYRFHALSAHADVLDASATRPTSGTVRVTVLPKPTSEVPPAELLAAVDAALNAEDVRPLNDTVDVRPAEPFGYQIEAKLEIQGNLPADIPLKAAHDALASYAAEQYRLGGSIRLSAIYAALHQPGVGYAKLIEPTQDIILDKTAAPHCLYIDVQTGSGQ